MAIRDSGGFVCIKDLRGNVPGYDGPQTFRRGFTRVSPDHAVIKAFPDYFAKEGTAKADTAIVSTRRQSGGRSAPHRSRHRIPTPARPAPALASLPRRSSELDVPQTRRPRAVTGSDIWDLGTVRGSVVAPQEAAAELRDRAMRAIERARFPHGRANTDAIRDHMAELVARSDDQNGALSKHLLVTGSPRYRDLFSRAARGLNLSPEEKRAMSLNGPDGGFVVPFTLDPTIVPTSSGVINALRAISRTETTLTDEWKGATSDWAPARYRGEGSEAEEAKPKLDQPTLKTHGADWWLPAAYEFGQDYGALEPNIAAMLQRAKDELEADKFLNGGGEDQPLGLLTAATETVETAGKGAFAAGDLEALEAALPPGFLGQAQYLGNRSIFKEIRDFPIEGANIWEKVPGHRPEINGILANQLSTMPDEVKADAPILALGDFNYFLIVDRLGMGVRFAEHFGPKGLPTGEISIYALWRNGSTLLSEKAFRVLTVKA